MSDRNVAQIETLLKEDCETAFTNARYGFISGVLRETYEQNKIKEATSTQIIDLFVTHKVLGFPIFILFMWIMFEATFRLGEYPMEWIESFVGWIGEFVRGNMSEGPLKDLLVDGIIGGVGGVIVFLPNILILYAFISFMEDSGYMARAAFIMDKIMHKMGLHGKSFIPLVMGFGCNVPAIMASRTIESRNSRMITMLVNPLMSCSARLPVYVLLTGAFFPQTAGTVMLILYASGILLAVLMARLFKRFLLTSPQILKQQAMKALKTTISVTELQKTLGLWKSRKITDSVIPKLLHLYLGMTAYMNQEKVYPVDNFYEISIALAFKNAKFLTEAVKRCGSFGIVPERNTYGIKYFYSPLWIEKFSSEELPEKFPETFPQDNIYNIYTKGNSSDEELSPEGDKPLEDNSDKKNIVTPESLATAKEFFQQYVTERST